MHSTMEYHFGVRRRTRPSHKVVRDDAMRYEIRVQGALDPGWSCWFGGLQITSEPTGVTVITGELIDQAALHGVLAKIRDLGLPLLLVRQLYICR
jgi:hypothetical protein